MCGEGVAKGPKQVMSFMTGKASYVQRDLERKVMSHFETEANYMWQL